MTDHSFSGTNFPSLLKDGLARKTPMDIAREGLRICDSPWGPTTLILLMTVRSLASCVFL